MLFNHLSVLKLLEITFQTAWIGPVIIAFIAVCIIIFALVKRGRKSGKEADKGNPKNKEGKKLYGKALTGGADDWYNMYLFAYEHRSDDGIHYRYKCWYDFLEKAADRGHPEAMCEHGKRLLYTNRNRGMELLEKSAAQGVDKACLAIAREYQHGLYEYFPEGVQEISKEECAKNAAKWLTMAAERNCLEAQTELGNILRFYLQDERGALEWFLKAAEQGYDEGQLGAARIYDKRKEFYKAQKYYILAAEQGNTYAQLDLAELLLLPEIYYDKDKALFWFEKSATGGNTFAMRKLSEIYLDGNIAEADINKCIYWLEKAAKEGDDTASYDIGMRYLNGDGVEKNEKQAVKYLKFSAGKYNDNAVCELGFCYLNGVGVEKNLEKAEKMFKRAFKEDGNLRAKEALDTYFNKKTD